MNKGNKQALLPFHYHPFLVPSNFTVLTKPNAVTRKSNASVGKAKVFVFAYGKLMDKKMEWKGKNEK